MYQNSNQTLCIFSNTYRDRTQFTKTVQRVICTLTIGNDPKHAHTYTHTHTQPDCTACHADCGVVIVAYETFVSISCFFSGLSRHFHFAQSCPAVCLLQECYWTCTACVPMRECLPLCLPNVCFEYLSTRVKQCNLFTQLT